MNSKHQQTLKSLFDNPVKKNIKWSDVEKLIAGVDGQIKQGDGSRIRIVLGEQSHTTPSKRIKTLSGSCYP